jgi:hypothetical protein
MNEHKDLLQKAGVLIIIGLLVYLCFLKEEGYEYKSSYGVDMLTGYISEKGLFVPHINNCFPTESFISLGIPNGAGFCIEKKERKEASWEESRKACALEGKRLPEIFEWKLACNEANNLGLENMTTNANGNEAAWEWSSNSTTPMSIGEHQGIGTAIAGDGGCGRGSWEWIALVFDPASPEYVQKHQFRCVR